MFAGNIFVNGSLSAQFTKISSVKIIYYTVCIAVNIHIFVHVYLIYFMYMLID